MRYICLLFFAFLAFSGCDDELLEVTPRNSVSTESFFRTESDLELYANGLVSVPEGGTIFLSDQSSDNAATTGAVEIKTIMNASPTSQTIVGGWDWERLRSVNFFLENIDRAEVSDAVKDHYRGLARMYRAEFYYDKVKRFSDVPWFGRVLNPDDEDLYKPQDDRAMVVDNVLEDLTFAAEHVREDVPVGTPDKWVATMLLARVALHEGTFRKYHDELNLEASADRFMQVAADAAEALIASGKFGLHITGNPTEDYLALFTSMSLAGNPEIIQYKINDFALGENAGYQFQVQDYELSPSRALVQTYLNADGSRFTDDPDYATAQFVEEFTDRDPRLSQTLAGLGWVKTAEGQTAPYVQELNKNFSGYHLIKGFINSPDEALVQSVDVPTMRYGEALLILAEAKAELGTLTQGDLDRTVNLLRERVGMPPLMLAAANGDVDPVMAADFPSVTGANTGIILEIRRERRVELAFEGRRFDDLKRWKAGNLFEKMPAGIYFPGLGQYDLTGDGVVDIELLSLDATVPEGEARENNSLGVPLIYYRTGTIGSEATVYLANGENGGATVTDALPRTFTSPRDYYRPIPFNETVLNPNLTQPFGWQ